MVIFHQSYWTQVLLTILRYEVPNILKYLENQVKQMHEMEVQHDEWQLKGLSEDSSVFLSHHLDSCIKSCRRAHLFPLSYEIGENNRSLISAPLWRMRYWWVGYRPKWVTSWVPETVDVCVIPIILYLFFFFLNLQYKQIRIFSRPGSSSAAHLHQRLWDHHKQQGVCLNLPFTSLVTLAGYELK